MRSTIEMAREAGVSIRGHYDETGSTPQELERLVELVRADEREQGQKWFDAVTAQHRVMILAEREACAKVCEELDAEYEAVCQMTSVMCGQAIRARGKT
jgi:hypothetical protein